MSAGNQYLLYTALLLGSIGAYGALNPKVMEQLKDSSVQEFITEAMSNGDVSSLDITTILAELGQKVDRNHEELLKRVEDVETSSDTMSLSLSATDGKVGENVKELAFITPDFQEQISENKSSAAASALTADTNLGTIDEIILPDVEDLKADVISLQENDVSLDTRIGNIESARETERVERSTMSSDIASVAEDVTTNLGYIIAIEDELTNVYTESINVNRDNVAAVADDIDFLTEKLRREVGEVADEVVCYSKFNTKGGAEISLSENPLRLGDSLDDSWMLYMGGGKGDKEALGFSRLGGLFSNIQKAQEQVKAANTVTKNTAASTVTKPVTKPTTSSTPITSSTRTPITSSSPPTTTTKPSTTTSTASTPLTAPSAPSFTGMAARLRVYDSDTTGFVVENSNDEVLFSVRGSDALADLAGELRVDTNMLLYSDEENDACFSHALHTAYPGLTHRADGNTVVTSNDKVFIRSKDSNRIKTDSARVTISPELLIDNGDRPDTHFNYNNEGNNWISAKSETNFRFGNNRKSVQIKHKEIFIDGLGVLAKLKSLEQEITNLKNDSSYVKTDGTQYWIKGHNGNYSKELGYSGDDARWSPNNTRMYLKFYKR